MHSGYIDIMGSIQVQNLTRCFLQQLSVIVYSYISLKSYVGDILHVCPPLTCFDAFLKRENLASGPDFLATTQ